MHTTSQRIVKYLVREVERGGKDMEYGKSPDVRRSRITEEEFVKNPFSLLDFSSGFYLLYFRSGSWPI